MYYLVLLIYNERPVLVVNPLIWLAVNRRHTLFWVTSFCSNNAVSKSAELKKASYTNQIHLPFLLSSALTFASPSLQKMSLRKLRAVGYPLSGTFKISDEYSFRHLVVWLEENIFATDLPNIVGALGTLDNSEWEKVFTVYLRECKCPFSIQEERRSVLDWLLCEAVRLVAEDHAAALAALETPRLSRNSVDIFPNINWNGEDLREGVEKMAELMILPSHPDCFVVMSVLAKMFLRAHLQKNRNTQEKPILNDVNTFRLKDIVSGCKKKGESSRNQTRFSAVFGSISASFFRQSRGYFDNCGCYSLSFLVQ